MRIGIPENWDWDIVREPERDSTMEEFDRAMHDAVTIAVGILPLVYCVYKRRSVA